MRVKGKLKKKKERSYHGSCPSMGAVLSWELPFHGHGG